MSQAYKIWYFLQLGYYWSCFFFQRLGFDVKRKDETQMLVHHVCTIILITASYIYGYYLIGGVILFLNDFNDFILNFGKSFDYIGKRYVAKSLFPIFGFTWFTNRIYLGITKVLYSSMFESKREIPNIPDSHLYIFNAMLVALAFLNLYWFYLLMILTYEMILGKKVTPNDPREEGKFGKEGEKKDGEKKDGEKKDGEKKDGEKKNIDGEKKDVGGEKKNVEKEGNGEKK